MPGIMKNQIQTLIILLIVVFYSNTYSQEKLAVEGAIIIKNSEDPSPEPGTIRWTGADFEGWNGSEWMSLTTSAVKDIDNNTYKIVTIGTQTWMAENLRVTRYNDGTAIPLVSDPTAWSVLTTPGVTWYNNGEEAPEYGALYNYYTVADTNSRNVCPEGWHVPSDAEWTSLTDYLGGVSIAGEKMKETGLTHWTALNTGATNESGFTGLPGGYLHDGMFLLIKMFGAWWSSTESGASAWYRSVDYSTASVSPGLVDKRSGFSVRCVRD